MDCNNEYLFSLRNNSDKGFCITEGLYSNEGVLTDSVFIEVNNPFSDILNLSSDKIIGQQLTALFTHEEASAILLLLRGLTESPFLEKKGIYLSTLNKWLEVTLLSLNEKVFTLLVEDVSEAKQKEMEQRLSLKVLTILNRCVSQENAVKQILTVIKQETGVDAAAIRLKSGKDYPYFVYDGFSDEFVSHENSLLLDSKNSSEGDNDPPLECFCGAVIAGRTFPSNPFSTKKGSVWTNNLSSILDLIPSEDPRLSPRRHCYDEGYISIALIPLYDEDTIIGLIQLNDRRANRFSLKIIEFFEQIGDSIAISLKQMQFLKAIKDREKSYKHLSKEFEAIMDHIPGLIFYKDLNNNFIQVNKYVAEAYNKTKEELRGVNLSQLYDYDVAESYHKDDLIVIESGEALLNIEEPWMTDQGVKWVNTSKIPFTDESGYIAGIIGISFDITDRKLAEEELKKKQEDLTRLKQKNAVLATIVTANHEINQPLTIIRGNLELMAKGIKDKTLLLRYETIIESLDRIDKVIKKLRDLDEIKLRTYLDEIDMIDLDE